MKKFTRILVVLTLVLLAGYLIPESIKIPVVDASTHDWNHKSFWFEPWGTSGVHKGIDIFAQMGAGVTSTTNGVVLYAGQLRKGGKVVVILGPKWRFHYFAHLDTINTSIFSLVGSGELIGTVGTSGNATGKPPHLHYSIVRLIPVPWAIDNSTQGYKKAFFIDPSLYLIGQL